RPVRCRGSAGAAPHWRGTRTRDGPGRTRPVARVRAERRPVCARAHQQPRGLHLRHASARCAEPRGGTPVEDQPVAVLQSFADPRADRWGARLFGGFLVLGLLSLVLGPFSSSRKPRTTVLPVLPAEAAPSDST